MTTTKADTGLYAIAESQGIERIDILIIHALLDSLFTIFATMVHLKIAPGTPVLKGDKEGRGDVSALVAMVSERAQGSVALSFPLAAVRKVALNMLGEVVDGHGSESQDLVGELTNMLVGGAKKIMLDQGYDFDMRTPELYSGKNHQIAHPHNGATVLLPIRLEDTEFHLELNFE
jgi:chemotaxis protein CheX